MWRHSGHALAEMTRRGIAREVVDQVLRAPGQRLEERDGILALQSVIEFPDGRKFLVRVFVNRDEPPVVVTVYRTSKIAKYWR
ncbi:MAG: DUF4258 domain-containing protein [Hydrogenophilales bacterium]|nr:DUF4258 domain-containing protein [Hydrogenophilales bacterium]